MATTSLRQCNHCQQEKPHGDVFWKDKWYCSRTCRHAAGDRSACYGWNCGCTHYAKKRRLLRAHRENMRVIDEFIQEQGLEEELEDRMIDETGNTNFWLGHIDYMDEDSEQEDPEAALRQELADKNAFVEAAAGVLQYSKMAADLEHARLMLEDVRSQQLR